MAGDIISKRARNLLSDHLSAWTLKEIRDEFEEVGIEEVPDPSFEGGQRRTLVAAYYNGLDFSKPRDAQKFVSVATLILTEVERRVDAARAAMTPAWSNPLPSPEHPLVRFIGEMKKCGFIWKDGAFRSLSIAARLADTKALAEQLDLAHLGEHIRRIESSIDTDPRQAIGSAKEMVETVAKTILERRGSPPERGADVLELGKAVFKALKQVPDDVPDAAKGAATIKRMLSNLASLVHGIAELRGFYGTGHGQEGKAKGLSPRHARLAVGAAATLAWYWLETDREMPL